MGYTLSQVIASLTSVWPNLVKVRRLGRRDSGSNPDTETSHREVGLLSLIEKEKRCQQDTPLA